MWKKFYFNVILCGLFISFSIVLGLQYKRINDLKHELNNNYTRAFYDMVGYVENINTIMTKASICTTCSKTSNFLEDIWHKANMAQENLNMIPINQTTLNKTSKYLNQVGDFAYALNKQNLSKKGFNNEQYETLQKLQTYAEILLDSLQKMENDINHGTITWDKLKNKGKKVLKTVNKNINTDVYMYNLEKNFQDYPTLIYDGPFSEHINKMKPKALNGNNISEKEAKKIVIEFLKLKDYTDVKQIGITKGNIETYNFLVTGKNNREFYIDVTKIGGHIYSMICNRSVEKESINMDNAKEKALKFLRENGYNNMKDTYYLKQDNQAIINYVAIQDDVVCYPDLIKVKVALDTGEITGFEAREYITSHTKREFNKTKILLDDAKRMVNKDVKILSTNMALIPTEIKTEVLTYEIKGKLNSNDFLVYVNVETGEIENVLMITNTPNGVLTI